MPAITHLQTSHSKAAVAEAVSLDAPGAPPRRKALGSCSKTNLAL